MKNYLLGGLVANAASLGYHWVYNPEYLEELSKKQSLLFQLPNLEQYNEAGKSYFSYPLAKVGDFTSQGMFVIWLYEAWKKNPDLMRADYENLIYSKVRPGGDYQGYVESYSKMLVVNKLNSDLNLGLKELELDDDHINIHFAKDRQILAWHNSTDRQELRRGWDVGGFGWSGTLACQKFAEHGMSCSFEKD